MKQHSSYNVMAFNDGNTIATAISSAVLKLIDKEVQNDNLG